MLALIGAGLAAGYVVSLGGLYLAQDALVFPGAWLREPPPASRPTSGWRIEALARADAPPLTVWHRPSEGRRAILMLHGNAGHPLQFVPHAQQARRRGWDVVAPIYRGFSGTPGRPSQAAVLDDARATWRWIVDELQIPPDQIVIHGHSLGGGVAAALSAEVDPPLLVLASTFDSLVDWMTDRYPMFPVRSTFRHPFDSATALAERTGPVLLLHATDDPVVPVSRMHRLAQALPHATVVEVPTGGHDPPVGWSQAARDAWLAALDAVPQPADRAQDDAP